jgi:hypothetical protein
VQGHKFSGVALPESLRRNGLQEQTFFHEVHSRCQCYKTFCDRKLRIFIIS